MEWEPSLAEDLPPTLEDEVGDEEEPEDEEFDCSSPQSYHCSTCDIDFECETGLHKHILRHVTLPMVLIEKLKGFDFDDEDEDEWQSQSPFSGASDYEEDVPADAISQNLNADKLGLSKLLSCITVKKVNEINQTSNLPTLSSMNLPMNRTEVKKIIPASSDLVRRLESLGAIKLKLKKQTDNPNFEVINGEDERHEDMELDSPVDGKQELEEPVTEENMNASAVEEMMDEKPVISHELMHIAKDGISDDTKPQILQPEEQFDEKPKDETLRLYQEKYQNERNNVIKNQVINVSTGCNVNVSSVVTSVNNLFSSANTTTISSAVSSTVVSSAQDTLNQVDSKEGIVKLPLPKLSEPCTIIELDSDDSNDIPEQKPIVSAIDVKPTIILSSSTTLPSQTASIVNTSMHSGSSFPQSMSMSNEKQHSFNWNAPHKSSDLVDKKSTDAILDKLLAAKEEDPSEYISLETLGPQHCCDACNLRFTSISLLEQHKRSSCPSSKNLILPQSRQLALPGNEPLGLLSNLLPVKQIADQMRLSSVSNANTPFAHQQNVLINIQSFPGQMGQYPVQPYGQYQGQSYPGGPTAPFSQQDPSQGMYRPPHPDYPNYPNRFNHPQHAMPGQTQMHASQQMHSPQQMQQHQQMQQQQQQQQAYNQAMGASSQSTNYPRTGQAPNPALMHPPFPQNQNQQGQPNQQPLQQSSQSPYPPGAQGSNVFDQNHAQQRALGQSTPGSSNSFPGPGQIPGKSPSQPAENRPQANAPPRMTPGMRPPAPRSDQILNPKDPRAMKKRVILRPNMRWPEMAKMKMNQQKFMKRPMPHNMRPGANRMRPGSDMLLPGRHDNEDCQVVSMQRQINGMPVIDSVKGSRDTAIPNIGDSITITKTKCTPPPKSLSNEANKVANLLLSRGIMVKPKTKPPTTINRSSPLANLSREVSIKQVSKPQSPFGSSFKCRLCEKSFVTQSGLNAHMSMQHWEEADRDGGQGFGSSGDFGLPVVDLSQKSTIKRLNDLGITNFIPLSKRESSGGCFGLPVVSLNDESRSNLQTLGAQGLLSLGPIKRLPY